MSKEPTMTHRGEMETLLPFYLNGTLSGEDLRQVEDWLANDPAADEALLAAESELALVSEDNESLRPGADAFKRFSAALEKEPGPKASAASWLSAFVTRTFAVPAPLAFATAAAMLALLIVGVKGTRPIGESEIEVAGAGSEASAPFVLVTFADGVSLAAIAKLVADSGGRFADGPIAGSTFKVALPVSTVADYDKAAAALSASPLVSKLMTGRKPDASN